MVTDSTIFWNSELQIRCFLLIRLALFMVSPHNNGILPHEWVKKNTTINFSVTLVGCLQHCNLTAPPTSIWVPGLPFCTPFVSRPLTPLGMQRLSCTVGLVGTGLARRGSIPHLSSGFCVLIFGLPTLHVSSKLLALAGEWEYGHRYFQENAWKQSQIPEL